MRKYIYPIAALLSLFIASSCGGGGENPVATDADFEMKSLNVDTVCMLFNGKDAPRCDVRYNLRYAEGKDAAFINDILTHDMFPENTDSVDMEQAALNEMRSIVADYKATLRGVTRKSITEGSFPADMAQYKRSVSASCAKVKNGVLVYTATVQEKAYGETDSLVNQFTFNISISDRALITPDNIFVPGYKDRLIQKIVGNLASQYKVSGMEGLRRKGIFTDGIPFASDNIIISEKDITFVYNPFEIAGRRHGMISVTIPADEVKDIMEKRWITFFETK